MNRLKIIFVTLACSLLLASCNPTVKNMLALQQDRILSATIASSDIFPVPGPDEPWTEEGIAKRRAEILAMKARGTMNQKWDWLAGLMSKGGFHLQQIRRSFWDT